jgi:hypothetical protein
VELPYITSVASLVQSTHPSSEHTPLKNLKYLEMTLTKEVKILYNENYKPLKKETGKDIRRWKDLLCLWVSRINIVKMAILLKTVYMFGVISIKIPIIILTDTEKSTLKFIWKHNRL